LNVANYVEEEILILKSFFKINIYAVSMHKPSKWILDNDIRFKKYINTYSKKYFKEFKYFSDSRRQWKEGCICNKIDVKKYSKLHILIHSFWWTESDISFNKRMVDFINGKINKLETDLENNISVYKKNRNRNAQ